MAAPTAQSVIRAPGKLVKDPTSLTGAYPYGGTELGVVRTMEFRPNVRVTVLRAEEWKRPVAHIVTGEEAAMAGVLRSWDADMLALLFPNTRTGATTGKPAVEGLANSGNRAGFRLEARALKLLFAPDAVDYVPMVLIYRAVAVIDAAASMAMRITEEWGTPFMFAATPDSEGRDYRVMFKDDLAAFL